MGKTLKLSEISHDPVAFSLAQKEIKEQLLKKPRSHFERIIATAVICPWIILPTDLEGKTRPPHEGPEYCLKLRQKHRPHWVKTGQRPYFVNVSPKRWLCLDSEKYAFVDEFGNVIPDKRYRRRDDWLNCPIFKPSQTVTRYTGNKEITRKDKIGVLTPELKAEAGLDVKYVMDFSSGTAGLKKVKVDELKKKR